MITKTTTTDSPATTEPPPTRELLNGGEAMAFLHVSRATFYGLVKQGYVTAYKIAPTSRALYKRSELLAALKPVSIHDIDTDEADTDE